MIGTGSRVLDSAAVRYTADGLVAAVAQDARDGRVLMVAWQDAEAVEASLATSELHFHSRSRGRLWKKGETSGNVLRVVSAALDCDGDALLWTVDPTGPACHTDARSCFDAAPGAPEPEAGHIEVTFARAGAHTEVTLRHTGWVNRPDGAAARERYARNWPVVLGAFVSWTPQAVRTGK